MSPRGRKRRRSEEDGAPGAESSANLENGAEVTSEKEREMWDAFRDEYSEGAVCHGLSSQRLPDAVN